MFELFCWFLDGFSNPFKVDRETDCMPTRLQRTFSRKCWNICKLPSFAPSLILPHSINVKRSELSSHKSQDDFKRFCCAHAPMYFVIDQRNALDDGRLNMDTVSNEKKAAVQEYLASLTSGHYRTTSASANHKNNDAQRQNRKATEIADGWNDRSEQISYSSLFFFHLIYILYS